VGASTFAPGALMPNLGMKGEQSKALAAYLLSLK